MPPLAGSLGFLDGEGRATATFTVPPGVAIALVGKTFFHAAGSLDFASGLVTHTSNPVAAMLVP